MAEIAVLGLAGVMHEQLASGPDAIALATRLLQRRRLEQPDGGIWEAADVQWWSRRSRTSDAVELPFWLDDSGDPTAAVLLTSWTDERWQVDPLTLGHHGPDPATLWSRAIELVHQHARGRAEILLGDHDPTFTDLVTGSGFAVAEHSATAMLDAAAAPPPRPPRPDLVIVDRGQRADVPHPMRSRNGDAVAERLLGCSLYDPALDLAVETEDGAAAGYALFWADPVTRVGLVEPVRVEDAHQRQGLATALLIEGIARLVARGMRRIKIGYESEAAAGAYHGVGFRTVHTDTTYQLVL